MCVDGRVLETRSKQVALSGIFPRPCIATRKEGCAKAEEKEAGPRCGLHSHNDKVLKWKFNSVIL